MENLDTYLNLCTEVYDLSKPVPPEDAYYFYRSYMSQANGAILEPMCGTGRFMLPFIEEGFNVSGFDTSKYMLNALKSKADLKKLHPNVWQGFAQNLSTTERYNLIFIPSGSFGLIIDPLTVKSTLQKFYDHLTNDGIFVFEAETFKSVPQLGIWRGSKWLRVDGKIILLSTFATLESNICSSIGKYELIEHNKIIHTEIEELKVRLYETEELVILLKQTGFKDIKTIKAFDPSKPSDLNDEVIIYECRK